MTKSKQVWEGIQLYVGCAILAFFFFIMLFLLLLSDIYNHTLVRFVSPKKYDEYLKIKEKWDYHQM